jgi:hypothetical protein
MPEKTMRVRFLQQPLDNKTDKRLPMSENNNGFMPYQAYRIAGEVHVHQQ